MKKNSLDQLTAEELYELARQREQEEQEQARELLRTRLEELREQRRELVAEQKRALAALDREIHGLNRQVKGGVRNRRVGDKTATQQIVDTISAHGPIGSADLKALLDEQGFNTKNLNQQLAYLKRRGQVSSPQRAVYAVA